MVGGAVEFNGGCHGGLKCVDVVGEAADAMTNTVARKQMRDVNVFVRTRHGHEMRTCSFNLV